MEYDREELSAAQITAIKQCKSADDVLALAKEHGVEMTRDEAEACLAELQDFKLDKLDDSALDAVAGGGCWTKSICPIDW